jgi:hypothetical protein
LYEFEQKFEQPVRGMELTHRGEGNMDNPPRKDGMSLRLLTMFSPTPSSVVVDLPPDWETFLSFLLLILALAITKANAVLMVHSSS